MSKNESEVLDLNYFRIWLQDLKRFGKGNHIEVVEGELDSDEPNGKLKVRIYTDINKYAIVGIRNEKYEGHSYLGCIGQSRKPRAGETWTRGNDLPDGPLTFETWYSIITGIIGYELVKVHSSKPQYVQEGIPEGPVEGPSLGESTSKKVTEDDYSWYRGSVDEDVVNYIAEKSQDRKP